MILLPKNSEKQLSRIITILVYGLKAIGLAPFSHEIGTTGKTFRVRSFRYSKIGLAYNIIILSLLQVMDAIALPTLFSLSYPNSSSVTKAIDVVQGVVCCLTTYVITITWTFRQNKAVSVLNRLTEVDRLLSGIENERISNERILILFSVHMIVTACLWTTSRTTGALLVTGKIAWVFYTVSNFVVYWFIVEYSIVLGLVARELERVNKNLSKLKFPTSPSLTPSLFSDYLPILITSSSKSRLNPLTLLLTIRSTLYELSKDIAEFFSFPILLSIGYFFFVLVYNVYYLIYTVLSLNDEISFISLSNSISWIITVIYPIGLLSLNVTNAAKEAELTGWTIQKLLTTAMRPEIKAELREFSLQLLHEHFRFTAYGFFTLDCTLLHSILQATAMYNVILIQLSNPEEKSSSDNDA